MHRDKIECPFSGVTSSGRPWRKGTGKRGSEFGLAVARDWTRMVLGSNPRVTWAIDNCNREGKKQAID